jgi:hypothetical protein
MRKGIAEASMSWRNPRRAARRHWIDTRLVADFGQFRVGPDSSGATPHRVGGNDARKFDRTFSGRPWAANIRVRAVRR